MTQDEQQEHFLTDIGKVIDRYKDEYEISYASVVGCLRLVAAHFEQECLEVVALEDEEEEGKE